MAAQSALITCPTGQWTSIAQQLDRRQALLVQCPQMPNIAVSIGRSILNDGLTQTLITANPLRKRLVWSKGNYNASTAGPGFIWPGAVIGGTILGITDQTPVIYDTGPNSQVAAALWNASFLGDGTHPELVGLIVETAVCPALVLGINNGVPTYTGTYGTTPYGLWTSPDLASGPATFRLSRANDFELVTQEWFAWPIGTGNVTVQVYQSFDSSIDVPPTTQDAVQVRLPRLSPMALSHLELLKKRLNGELPDVP